MSSYPPTPQRKACDCSDPCISTDDVYYAGPNLPNSGINTYNVLTSVIEKLDAIYAVPTLQKVTEVGNYTTLPIIADSFVKIGGDGDNILLDNGTVLPIGDLPGNTQTLAETLVLGNNTGGTNIYLNDADSLYLENGSYIQKGRYDFGAAGGVSRICGVGYEDMWQAGFRHVFDANGFIRNSTNCFNVIPDIDSDVTRRYKIGSIWTLDDLTNYICTDATEGAAVWELYKEIPIAPYKVYTALLTQIDAEAPVATVLENTIGNIVWSYNNIGVYTALSIGNFTVNKTAVFISSQGFGGGYGLVTSVNNANNGSQITITTQNSIGGVNGNLENTSIEIRVYN
jgi:hypothetical protein